TNAPLSADPGGLLGLHGAVVLLTSKQGVEAIGHSGVDGLVIEADGLHAHMADIATLVASSWMTVLGEPRPDSAGHNMTRAGQPLAN
ncbi:MAG: hypothetical protein VX871_03535, partial [Pseudomonadota bacterium]|nr:hypothetical protein [Pseudomonadota bacterium]